MPKAYIYGLYDPRNDELKYVGKTKAKRLSERLKEHIRKAKREQTSPRDRWIVELLDKSKKPYIIVLDECIRNDYGEAEKWWIALCKDLGFELTNLTDGGEEGSPEYYKFTKEHRKKIGKKSKGNQHGLGYQHSEEIKRKMSERMRGENNPNYRKDFSPEHRAKLSAAAKRRKHSPETKEKMRQAALKRNENPDYIKKLSDAALNASPEIKKKKSLAAIKARKNGGNKNQMNIDIDKKMFEADFSSCFTTKELAQKAAKEIKLLKKKVKMNLYEDEGEWFLSVWGRMFLDDRYMLDDKIEEITERFSGNYLGSGVMLY